MTKLAKANRSTTKSHHLYLFSSKLLAITYFRIPEVGGMIANAIALETPVLEEFDNALQADHQIPSVSKLSVLLDKQTEEKKDTTKLHSSFPGLFQWGTFHSS